ncbi:MAG: 3-hydroxyacyl-CoA dehydrogenase NAD-binding domain-containing protein [Bacteriovorax sp.]|jgi:3-hydroxybutyryl-CoA dehydrogenase
MEINNVVIIGAGTMGQGIAQWFVQQNISVEMVDQNHEFALMSLEKIHRSLDKLVENKKLQAPDVLNFKKNISVKKIDEVNKNADLVIEAIIEDLEAKKKLLAALDQSMSKKTIIATNTSSFPILQLAQALSVDRRKKFLGLHFFNPATIMKLVEVIACLDTDSTLAQIFVEWFNGKSKVACLCSDSPGFIVNRVARNFYGEALRAADIFDAEKFREIDLVMKDIGGFKMGPFELMDLIGIDVNFSVTESVYKAFFDEARFKPHRLQRDMVLAGRLGKKTGKGFYHYES